MHKKAIKHIKAVIPLIDNIDEVKSYLHQKGIEPPVAKNDEGFKARMLCRDWWSRTLTRADHREEETKIIQSGRVRDNCEKYASNLAVFRAGVQAQRMKQFEQDRLMLSSEMDLIPMEDVIKNSLANPNNRRAELMIRMAGFESHAQQGGYVGEFYTITCPSKYHRFSGKHKANKNYAHNPKQAQQYLVKQWSKIRSSYARANISIYGFRVCEPHHDGCPHWHLLLFVRPEQVEKLRGIVSHYALEVDGYEAGARPKAGCNHSSKGNLSGARFKAVAIDPEAGTATGYIAKYISKNLGFDLESSTCDQTDKSRAYGQRVKAWAHTWGVRQFQQIGGAPVTVWRQLRKLREPLPDPLLEQARQAADNSQWSDFLTIMGGIGTKRADMTIQLLKTEYQDIRTGELKQNKYHEVTNTIIGIYSIYAQAMTKTKNWLMISRIQADRIESENSEQGGYAAALFRSPWSPVNNCTGHMMTA